MNKLVHRSMIFLNRNASTILTCIGGVGVVATAILAVKATPKALEKLEEAKEEKGEELTKTEIIVKAAPIYIPTIMTGVTTLACIFGANVLDKRRQASLISAYALLDTSFKEYKNKVTEEFGDETNSHIRSEIAKDKYKNYDISVEDDEELFFDMYSGRYFASDKASVIQAQYDLNHELAVHGSVSVNALYKFLGVDPIEGGDEIGWSIGMCFDYYWESWIKFINEPVILDDGLHCTLISYSDPYVDYDYY